MHKWAIGDSKKIGTSNEKKMFKACKILRLHLKDPKSAFLEAS